MKRSLACVLVLALACTVAAVAVYGQVKQDAKTKMDRIEGTVQSVNTEKSEISVRQSGSSNTIWVVGYSPQTKFTYRNGPSTVDEVKDTRRVICLGKMGPNNKLEAARIDVRSGK